MDIQGQSFTVVESPPIEFQPWIHFHPNLHKRLAFILTYNSSYYLFFLSPKIENNILPTSLSDDRKDPFATFPSEFACELIPIHFSGWNLEGSMDQQILILYHATLCGLTLIVNRLFPILLSSILHSTQLKPKTKKIQSCLLYFWEILNYYSSYYKKWFQSIYLSLKVGQSAFLLNENETSLNIRKHAYPYEMQILFESQENNSTKTATGEF